LNDLRRLLPNVGNWHVASSAALQRIGRFRRKADKQETRRLPFVTRPTQSGHSHHGSDVSGYQLECKHFERIIRAGE
jgi:hypothetical protein